MSLACSLFGHRLRVMQSLYTHHVICDRCGKHWDDQGGPMVPLFDKAEVSRAMASGVQMRQLSYVSGKGPSLPAKAVAFAWLDFVLKSKTPPQEQAMELIKMAKDRPEEFIKSILGK